MPRRDDQRRRSLPIIRGVALLGRLLYSPAVLLLATWLCFAVWKISRSWIELITCVATILMATYYALRA